MGSPVNVISDVQSILYWELTFGRHRNIADLIAETILCLTDIYSFLIHLCSVVKGTIQTRDMVKKLPYDIGYFFTFLKTSMMMSIYISNNVVICADYENYYVKFFLLFLKCYVIIIPSVCDNNKTIYYINILKMCGSVQWFILNSLF